MSTAKHASRRHDKRSDTTDAVDAFMRTLDHPLKEDIEALRRIVIAADPSIAEGIKWNAPSFRTHEYFATMHLRKKDEVGLVLHLGAAARDLPESGLHIEDPDGLLNWLAKDRAVIGFSGTGDLDMKRNALQDVLRQWIRHV